MSQIKGGTKLEAALREIAAKVKSGAVLKVGFMEDATYPDGTSVALVAASNNFGTKTIPARPFFTNMVKDEAPTWPSKLVILLKANDYDAKKSLEVLGEDIAGALRQSITDGSYAPLSPVTVARKGFDKPLIWHSIMINSVAQEVEEK